VARGLGRALQRAVSREGTEVDLEGEGRSLANARRRQVFRYLCLRPCARIGDISRDLKMSPATVRWHTWDLVENRYLGSEGVSVFPTGLIDPQDVPLFAALAAAGRAAVLAGASEAPGLSFQDIASRVGLTRQSVSKIALELGEMGLVRILDDGRFRRLHPTDFLGRKREANRARARAFQEALLRRLSDEGLAPELVRREETTLLVRFGIGGRRVLLEVPVDPYETSWKPPV
jgi:DNA-binding transcriptional ArsR family regulator